MEFRNHLDTLHSEGFRPVYVLATPEEVASVEIVRTGSV
jgi:hypothetical protein